MELFNFLQNLSFSPVRTLVQDRVLKLCDLNLSHTDILFCLNQEFPELKAIFLKCNEGSQNIKTDCHRLIYGHKNYPSEFRNLSDPPWVLTVWGSLKSFQSRRKLSIVGSREPLPESIQWIERELHTWPERGWAFLSGGARGIDQKAHQICLRQKKPTAIFIPSGIEQIYPSSLMAWKNYIEESQSCIVSEFPDRFQMRKYSFSFRNRLIAAGAEALLVIEAGEKSGTLMTANLALEMGRPVFVVPGHPSQKKFHGCLDLLREGAQWIGCAQDLSILLDDINSGDLQGSLYTGLKSDLDTISR